MPTVKSRYELDELEKEWKKFKPTLAPRTGVGEALHLISDSDLKNFKSKDSATQHMQMFVHDMEKIQAAEKLSQIKSDKNALAFLAKAAETVQRASKPFGQAQAGIIVYDKEKKAWVASSSIKKQTGH